MRQARTILILLMALAAVLHGQEPRGSNVDVGASPPAVETDAGRPVSWPGLVPNLVSDQKRIWTFPARLARGRNWGPVAFVVGVTAALIATDAKTAGYFRRTDTFRGFNSVMTGNATLTGVGLTPLILYGVGAARHDRHARNTALLAGEAVADAEILATVFKDIDRRRRPAEYGAGSDFSGSWFSDQGSWVRGIGSFPSGHTIAAFSVATVLARRYPKHRWIPYLAYGLSGVVGFSRMTLSSHYASDVFLGGALGYFIGRFAVLRQ